MPNRLVDNGKVLTHDKVYIEPPAHEIRMNCPPFFMPIHNAPEFKRAVA